LKNNQKIKWQKAAAEVAGGEGGMICRFSKIE
jgi:hypothetical protein